MGAISCKVGSCLNPARAKGLCKKHEHQKRSHGRPLGEGDARRKFWSKVDVRGTNECWPWRRTTSHGYGYVRIGGQPKQAHRVAYEYLVGPIPEGLELDHRCHTPACTLGEECPHRRCCNPAHLKPVTTQENCAPERSARNSLLVARQRAITHCPQGHEYTEANTMVDKRGWRRCRTCFNERR